MENQEPQNFFQVGTKPKSEKRGLFGKKKEQQTEKPVENKMMEVLNKLNGEIIRMNARMDSMETTFKYTQTTDPALKPLDTLKPTDIPKKEPEFVPGERIVIIPEQKVNIWKGKEQDWLEQIDKLGIKWTVMSNSDTIKEISEPKDSEKKTVKETEKKEGISAIFG